VAAIDSRACYGPYYKQTRTALHGCWRGLDNFTNTHAYRVIETLVVRSCKRLVFMIVIWYSA